MTKRIRPFFQSLGAAALVAGVFMFQACGGGNDGMTGAAGTGSPAGVAGNSGTAGTTGDGGTTGGGGTTGAGGSATGTGGTAAFGEPACLSTVIKNGACLPTDQQFCYKTCGPEKTGVKTEMCTTAGTYAEMSGCTFEPSQGFLLLQDPDRGQHGVPGGPEPQGSMDCGTVPHCKLCNSLGGIVGGTYLDSGGAPKTGWCTCQEPNGTACARWTCASDTAWPCPLGAGC